MSTSEPAPRTALQQAARKKSPEHCLKTVAILCGIGALLLSSGLAVGHVVIGRWLPTLREAPVTVPQIQPAQRPVESAD